MKKQNTLSPYYVYLHETLEGIPFYIGIGTKQYGDCETLTRRYARAYSKTGRTLFWRKIVNKYNYQVKILVESSDYEYIKQQEIHFISKYGRRDQNKGTLCNFTNGGDGNLGCIHSEQRKLQSSVLGKRMFEEGKSPFCRPGFYDDLSDRMKGNQYAKGTTLTLEQKQILYKGRLEKISKRIIQEDLEGNFIKEWYSTVDVAEHFKISRKAVWKACNNYYKGATSQNYKWKFKE